MCMQRIGVLSDTHLSGADKRLDDIVARHFAGIELVVHAGDMVSLHVLDGLYAAGKEIIAVSGNMDQREVEYAFPPKRILEVEEIRIGIIHGWGAPSGIRQRIRESFERVDAIIYGHTHQPFCGLENGIFFFNPGSPMDSRFTSMHSVGIIRIDDTKIQGEIITV